MNDRISLLELRQNAACVLLTDMLDRLPRTAGAAEDSHDEDATAHLLARLPKRVFDDLAADVADPVQLVRSHGFRTIVVLHIYAVVFELDTGFARAALLHDDGHKVTAIPSPTPSVRLVHSPRGHHWLRCWLKRWCLRQGYPIDGGNAAHALDCAARKAWRRACRRFDLRAMRRTIAAAMDYHPVHWGRAVQFTHAAADDSALVDYNLAIRLAPQLDALQREAPNLMGPWFALARDGFLRTDTEPKAALKRYVCSRVGGERTWRALAASPARVWTTWTSRSRRAASTAIDDTAELVKQFASSEAVPPQLMRALTRRLDPTVSLVKRIREGRCRHYPFALRAAKAAIAGGTWPRFLAELDEVDAWFDLEPPALDKLQRRRGWHWLARKARAWAEMQRLRHRASEALAPELPPLVLAGYEFSAATTPFHLWMAGRELRNCLGMPSWSRWIADGEALLVIARRSHDARAVAAIELREGRPGSALRVERALGFANGPAPLEVARLLPRVALHFNARGARLLPWRIGGRLKAGRQLAACQLPRPYNLGTTDLQLTNCGSVRLGHWERDYSTLPIAERFVTMHIVRGGQAQRLADHAITQAAGQVESHATLVAAIASALAAPPGYDHWLTEFGAMTEPERASGADPALDIVRRELEAERAESTAQPGGAAASAEGSAAKEAASEKREGSRDHDE